jgi:ABC-type antimicrobial peptide transport system permease subunit
MALGARPVQVLAGVMRGGLLLTGLGLGLGVVATFVATRFSGAVLAGLAGGLEPRVAAGAAGLLLGVAAAACYLPARRATRVDPMRTLRAE